MPVVVPAQPRLLPSGRAWCGRALGCDGCCGVGGCCCSAPACRARTCPEGTELPSGPAAAPAWSCQCRVWLPGVLGTELVPGLAEAPTGAGRSCGRSRLWRTCPCASPGRDSVLVEAGSCRDTHPGDAHVQAPSSFAPSLVSISHRCRSVLRLPSPSSSWAHPAHPISPLGGSWGGCPAVPRSPAGLAAGISRRVPILTSAWHLRTPTRAPAAGPVQPLESPQTPRAAPRGFSPSILPCAAC